MSKLSSKLSAVLAVITVLVIVCLQFWGAKPVLSEMSDLPTTNQLTLVATAAAPPKLVSAILGGQPVNVLYMTRAGERVLVRCYPGYQPTVTIQAMGGANAAKEGVLTCKSAA